MLLNKWIIPSQFQKQKQPENLLAIFLWISELCCLISEKCHHNFRNTESNTASSLFLNLRAMLITQCIMPSLFIEHRKQHSLYKYFNIIFFKFWGFYYYDCINFFYFVPFQAMYSYKITIQFQKHKQQEKCWIQECE